MTAQQLKNSILRMAVQGKLVTQDPNDEPASVLLERIKAEKEALIKSGKIKKSKKSSEIFRGASRTLPYAFCEQIGKEIRDISDEIPFEIPDNWCWCRLSHLYSILNGDRGKNYPSKDKLKKHGIPFISAINLDGKKVVEDDKLLCVDEIQYNLLNNGKLIKDDIVVCIRGSLGKHARFQLDRGAIASSLVIMRSYCHSNIFTSYLMLYLDSPLFFTEIKKYNNGTAQPNLAAKCLEEFFIPLPPLAEQKRIVAKIEELLPFIEKYEQAETKLTALNKSFPEMLKKSILQEAVQGKLVSQNPDDESASVLLERIRTEKQELIKQGKIKKSKHESIIVTRDKIPYEIIGGKERCIADEVPFETPESWEWARIFSIGAIIRGSGIKRTETINKGKPCIRYGELYTTYNIQFSNTVSFVSDNLFEKCKKITTGDLLFTLTGENKPDIAKTITYIGEKEVAIGGDLAYWTCHGMNSLYLTYFMCSPYAVNCKIKLATGDIIVHISGEKIGSILMPVPPLPEQKRIVEKIEELMTFCEKLK